MDNSLRSDKSMLPHNASPHSPRSSIPLRHGKDSGSFGLVAVAGAKESVFFLFLSFSLPIPVLDPSASRRLGRVFCGPTRRCVQTGAGAHGYAALPPAAATPYTAPSAPVARPFCTPAFGPRILRPYAPLRADWSGSASGYGGGRCLLMREAAAEESFFTFAP